MKSGVFKYLGSDDKTERLHNYDFDDSWLLNDSDIDNFDLLKFAFCLSLAPSVKEDVLDLYDHLGYSYTAETDYEKEGLNVLAGATVTDSVYYPAPVVDGKVYFNSIAYAIGFKKVEDTTLLLVAIRGGHYGSEWGGNFNIGTGINVKGFEIAAQQVLDGIKTTIEKNGITGKIKILTTGYSRAAATSNLVAAQLNNGAVDGITRENVFGFCFECPRNTRDPQAFSEKYNNIRSVTNPNDLIPKLAMSVFGFRRYGKTYYTAGLENDRNFYQKQKQMQSIERETLPFRFMASIDTAYMETEFVNDFAFVIGSPNNYVKTYQSHLETATAILFGGLKQEVSPTDLKMLFGVEQAIFALNPYNTTKIAPYLGSEPHNVFRLNFLSPILQNHAMELNLSWLESVTGMDDFSSEYYKLVYLTGFKDVTIKNGEGVIASVTGDKIEQKKERIYLSFDNNGQLVIGLNDQEDFTIDVTPEKLSTVYSRFNMTLGLKDVVAVFPESEAGKVEIKVDRGDSTNPTLSADGKALTAEKVLTGEEVKLIEIRPKAEIPLSVTGGGYFNYGETVRLEVVRQYQSRFKGWVVDGKLISSESVLTFKAENSQEVRAEFS